MKRLNFRVINQKIMKFRITLLNRINPSFQLQTQVISKALGRGKHTTRHCELHQVAQGWVADTPGFSSLDFMFSSK